MKISRFASYWAWWFCAKVLWKKFKGCIWAILIMSSYCRRIPRALLLTIPPTIFLARRGTLIPAAWEGKAPPTLPHLLQILLGAIIMEVVYHTYYSLKNHSSSQNAWLFSTCISQFVLYTNCFERSWPQRLHQRNMNKCSFFQQWAPVWRET